MNGYEDELREVFGFDEAVQSEESQDYIFFKCLKDGDEIEVRLDVHDNVYEVFEEYMWVDLTPFG